MQKASDYALGECPLAQHVAEKLEGLADGQTLPLSAMLADFHPMATDVSRVKKNELTNRPLEWMLLYGISLLEEGVEEIDGEYRLTRPYEKLMIRENDKRYRLPRREVWTEEQAHTFALERAYRGLQDKTFWLEAQHRNGMVELWVHPDAQEVNNETDLLPKARFIQLGLDMVRDGFDPAFPILIVKEGAGKTLRRLIIDGRHRAAAASAVGVKIEIREIDEARAKRTLLSANTGWRKPMTKVQIAWFSDKWFGDHAREGAKEDQARKPEDFVKANSPEQNGQSRDRIIAAAGTEGVVGSKLQGEVSLARSAAKEAGIEAEIEAEIMSGELTSSAAVKRKVEEKTKTPVEVPPSPSELSKTAWKRLGDAKSCLNLGIKALKEGRIGGTDRKPLTQDDWEDRFWEFNALLADFKFHVDDLYKDEDKPE